MAGVQAPLPHDAASAACSEREIRRERIDDQGSGGVAGGGCTRPPGCPPGVGARPLPDPAPVGGQTVGRPAHPRKNRLSGMRRTRSPRRRSGPGAGRPGRHPHRILRAPRPRTAGSAQRRAERDGGGSSFPARVGLLAEHDGWCRPTAEAPSTTRSCSTTPCTRPRPCWQRGTRSLESRSLRPQPHCRQQSKNVAPGCPGIMGAMNTQSPDRITVAAYENLPGRLRPMAAARA